MRSILILGSVFLAACQPVAPPAGNPPVTATSEAASNEAIGASPPSPSATPAQAIPAPSTTDAWLGKWTGPEGTALELSKVGSDYVVLVHSLDGPASYQGTTVGDHIEFLRNGRIESIRATEGAGTGMKWLLDKKNCLAIQPGEGFCRD